PPRQGASTPRVPGPIWSLLSSHPDTEARATELRAGHAPHCPRP
ncbi:MAG: peptidase M48, partial [Burkholderiaceae bacterium]